MGVGAPRRRTIIVPRLVMAASFSSVIPACVFACGSNDGPPDANFGGDVAMAFDRRVDHAYGGDVAAAFDAWSPDTADEDAVDESLDGTPDPDASDAVSDEGRDA